MSYYPLEYKGLVRFRLKFLEGWVFKYTDGSDVWTEYVSEAREVKQ